MFDWNSAYKRYHDKIIVTNDCWIWIGGINPNEYGKIYWNGGDRSAHSLAYNLYRGEVPDGFVLDHLCSTKKCVNPWHLEVVTQQVNLERAKLLEV